MRNPDRIKPFLETVEELWNKYPDWRFMQLICNLQRYLGTDGFYYEDDKMREILEAMIEHGEN